MTYNEVREFFLSANSFNKVLIILQNSYPNIISYKDLSTKFLKIDINDPTYIKELKYIFEEFYANYNPNTPKEIFPNTIDNYNYHFKYPILFLLLMPASSVILKPSPYITKTFSLISELLKNNPQLEESLWLYITIRSPMSPKFITSYLNKLNIEAITLQLNSIAKGTYWGRNNYINKISIKSLQQLPQLKMLLI